MTTYKLFAKSVENEPHTALGAASITRIKDELLPVPCTRIFMDEYFTGELYPTSEPLTTLHALIKAIQAIIAQDYDRALCNYHAITDLCIEIIDLHDNGVARVYIGS